MFDKTKSSPGDLSRQPPTEPLEHGPWYLYSKAGNLLARGTMDHGTPVGLWEYFAPNGQLVGRGQAAAGQMTGPWQSWDEEGHPLCQASYEIRSLDRSYPNYQPAMRHGKTVWWSSSGEVATAVEYIDGQPQQPVAAYRSSAGGGVNSDGRVALEEALRRIEDQFSHGTYADRRDAVRRLRAIGSERSARIRFARWRIPTNRFDGTLSCLSDRSDAEAWAAIPRLSRMAEETEPTLALAAIDALVGY